MALQILAVSGALFPLGLLHKSSPPPRSPTPAFDAVFESGVSIKDLLFRQYLVSKAAKITPSSRFLSALYPNAYLQSLRTSSKQLQEMESQREASIGEFEVGLGVPISQGIWVKCREKSARWRNFGSLGDEILAK